MALPNCSVRSFHSKCLSPLPPPSGNGWEDAGLTTEAAVLAAGEDGLRGAGLSGQKIVYSQALAEAQIDYDALRHVPDADVMTTLTAVKGIGIWTAEIYAMFSLGRCDVLCAG